MERISQLEKQMEDTTKKKESEDNSLSQNVKRSRKPDGKNPTVSACDGRISKILKILGEHVLYPRMQQRQLQFGQSR
jgi:hypothetical protein